MKKLNFSYGLDWLMAIVAFVSSLGVLQTFILGKHFIIPTMILVIAVIFGNLAWYGFQQQKWAKLVNFWLAVILTSHCFFALFWAKKYREILGDAFEPTAIVITLLLLALTWLYANKNHLFTHT